MHLCKHCADGHPERVDLLIRGAIEQAELEAARAEKAEAQLAIEHASRLASEARVAELEAALANVGDLGHNDDCIFCGLKDRTAKKAIASPSVCPGTSTEQEKSK